MKILITGSNGFLGKILQREFECHDLKTLSRSYSSYNFDISKEIPVFENQFDLVIHAAGKAHCVPKSKVEISEFYQTNVKGTYNLLKGLEVNGCPQKLVFISSVSVYGLESGIQINELVKLNANDPYGLSKILAEKLIIDWCKKFNITCTILRLPLVIGEDPKGNLADMIKGIKKGLYFNVSKGLAKKSMVLASDVSKFILKASEVGGIYNLTDGYHPSFNELSLLISKHFGRRLVPNMPFIVAKFLAIIGDLIGPSFPIDSHKLKKIMSTLTFDDSKARKTFGWSPTSVLKEFKL